MERPSRPPRKALHWTLLAVLLAALVAGAATFDRSAGLTAWPTVIGDEATYLMQAESLAFDLDLTYSRHDFYRFVRHWGVEPEGLILQKGEHGDELVYGKPFFYALWSAPFVRLSPTRGPFVANGLLLALAAVATARALRHTVGDTAPTWTAVLVFGSVTFAHVFWAHLDLFLLSLTALGLALVFGAAGRPSATPATRWSRWAAAGLLLATVAYARPLYATLLLPAALAAWEATRSAAGNGPREPRRQARRAPGALGAFAAGAVVLALGTLAVQESLVGSWSSYGAERRSFNGATGFPEVDLPRGDWDALIERWGNASWLKQRAVSGLSPGTPRLWGWNLLYFFAGESIGLLPYLLPGLLGFPSWRRAGPGPARWALLAAFALTAAGFFVLRPFNFWGGGGALANRYILPVFPALWFLPTRPVRAAWLGIAVVVAAPFLWPLWTAPRAYPLDTHGQFRYVSKVARAVLPYETNQSHMRPTGARMNVHHRGLWVKSLTPAVWTGDGGGTFRLDPGLARRVGGAALLVGSDRPLGAVQLEIETAALPLVIDGGRVTGRSPVDGGHRAGPDRIRLWIELDDPRARHPMWWQRDEDFILYTLRIEPGVRAGRTPSPVQPGRAAEPFTFTLDPVAR